MTLVFDYRFWGESEGEPRNQIFALEMVEDYRNSITWLSDLPEVYPQRIGVGEHLIVEVLVYMWVRTTSALRLLLHRSRQP